MTLPDPPPLQASRAASVFCTVKCTVWSHGGRVPFRLSGANVEHPSVPAVGVRRAFLCRHVRCT